MKRIHPYGLPRTEAEAPLQVAALRLADPARGSFLVKEKPKSKGKGKRR